MPEGGSARGNSQRVKSRTT